MTKLVDVGGMATKALHGLLEGSCKEWGLVTLTVMVYPFLSAAVFHWRQFLGVIRLSRWYCACSFHTLYTCWHLLRDHSLMMLLQLLAFSICFPHYLTEHGVRENTQLQDI